MMNVGRLRFWVIHYSNESPHKGRGTRMCVCEWLGASGALSLRRQWPGYVIKAEGRCCVTLPVQRQPGGKCHRSGELRVISRVREQTPLHCLLWLHLQRDLPALPRTLLAPSHPELFL